MGEIQKQSKIKSKVVFCVVFKVENMFQKIRQALRANRFRSALKSKKNTRKTEILMAVLKTKMHSEFKWLFIHYV